MDFSVESKVGDFFANGEQGDKRAFNWIYKGNSFIPILLVFNRKSRNGIIKSLPYSTYAWTLYSFRENKKITNYNVRMGGSRRENYGQGLTIEKLPTQDFYSFLAQQINSLHVKTALLNA
jgi:hypothetical protein